MKCDKRNLKKKVSSIGFTIIILISILTEIGCTTPIEQASKSIKENIEDSVIINSAMKQIWNLLSKDYPEDKYICNWYYSEFVKRLPEAVRNGSPFIITFAPKKVSGKARWNISTKFFELAGGNVTFKHMTPFITQSNGETLTFPDNSNAMTYTVNISAYGEGSYDWSCWGELKGSSVKLKFISGSYSTESYTNLE
jgi:hypothetical protein